MSLLRVLCLAGRHEPGPVGMFGHRVLEECRHCRRVRAVVLGTTGARVGVTYTRWGRSWCGLREAWRRSGAGS